MATTHNQTHPCWLAANLAMMALLFFTLTFANTLPTLLGERGARRQVYLHHQHRHNWHENVKREVIYPQVVLYNETNFLHLTIEFLVNHSKIVLDLRRNLILNGRVEGWNVLTKDCQFVSLESMAAFSLCEGMMGAFEWQGRDYLVQPLHPRSMNGNFRNLSFEHVLSWKEPLDRTTSARESTIKKIKTKSHSLCAAQRCPTVFEQTSNENIYIVNATRNHNNISTRRLTDVDDVEFSVRGYLRPKLKVATFSSKNYSTEQLNDVAYLKEDHINETFIEVFAIIDISMQNEHGKGIYNYILSLFGIAAGMLRHPSIGTAITLTVVDYHFLTTKDEKRIFGSEKFRDVHEILDDLNSWLWKKLRVNGLEGWDIAVLVTRRPLYNIIKKTADGFIDKEPILGITTFKAMCHGRSNGVIVYDNGLQTGFTIAHEIGHTLDLAHDNDGNCRKIIEQNGGFSKSGIMHAVLSANYFPWHWSECSRLSLTKFLNSNAADCLKRRVVKNNVRISINDDEKSGGAELFYEQLMVTNKLNSENNYLSGRRYSADEQCQILFGTEASICPTDTQCLELWCQKQTFSLPQHGAGTWDCQSLGTVWAPGTPCGDEKECFRGQCVPSKTRQLVHGEWSPWSKWTVCSRHCSGGVRWSMRTCTNPPPSDGGRFCVGPSHRYQSCNTQACSHGFSTRDVQCETFSTIFRLNEQLRGRFQAEDERPCELTCVFKNNTDLNLGISVKDGTPCYPQGVNTGVCVRGQCRSAGCDNILGSQKKFDKCGICDGDGSTCYQVEGTIQQLWPKFRKIIFFPKNAYNISVKTINHSGSNFFLAISDEKGNYLLHGRLVRREFRPDKEVRQMLAGAWMIYKGAALRGEEESLQLLGRINQNIFIDIWPKRWEHEMATMQMSYSFMTPNVYRWNRNSEVWSKCNKTCQGYSHSDAVCVHFASNTPVNNSLCQYAPQPSAKTRKCNLHCRLEWFEERELCNVRCGIGGSWLYRTCHKVHLEADKPNNDFPKTITLLGLPQPQEVCLRELGATDLKVWEKCRGKCHAVSWVYGNWSSCSSTCGHGYRIRKYYCVDNHQRVWPEKECDDISSATFLEACKVSCWIPREWSACSSSCGNGHRFRDLACIVPLSSIKKESYIDDQEEEIRPESECRYQPRPLQEETCSIPICARWFSLPWSSCSTTCGEESWRYRTVLCLPLQVNGSEEIHDETRLDKSICMTYAADSQPEFRQKCELSPCPLYNWQVEKWSPCSTSCGDNGVQHRSVWCREIAGPTYSNISQVSEEICREQQGPGPTRLQACSRVECPYWRIGQWSSCSRSCGGGVQTRKVTCTANVFEHYVNNKDELQDNACSTFVVIKRKKTCNEFSCLPSWHIGLWSACSASCGNGAQFRSVTCVKDRKSINIKECESKLGDKPLSMANCTASGSPFCPIWRLRNDSQNDWTPCSKSCDGGWQEKMLECVLDKSNSDKNWRRLPDSRCAAEATPPPPRPQRPCNSQPCQIKAVEKQHFDNADRFQRQKKITKRLGKRHKQRHLKSKKRRLFIKNQLTRSHVWYQSGWSECMVPCGVGVRRRTVACMSAVDSQVVGAHLCLDHTPRPAMSQVCKRKVCPGRIQWRMEPAWQACSGACGFQKKQRRAFCVAIIKASNSTIEKNETQINEDDAAYLRLPEKRCLHLSALPPLISLPCQTKECQQFMWRAEAWSKCLARCGEFGIRTRNVTCTKRAYADRPSEKRVNVPLEYCIDRPLEVGAPPPVKQTCQSGPCAFHWATTPWSSCPTSCGLSYRTRHVYCSHIASNIRVDNKHCDGHEKPSYYNTCSKFEC